jgi:predicted DNA-binding transcriptional regulator AlpA
MITVGQAAQMLGMRPNLLLRLTKAGKGPRHYKIGNCIHFLEQHVSDWEQSKKPLIFAKFQKS